MEEPKKLDRSLLLCFYLGGGGSASFRFILPPFWNSEFKKPIGVLHKRKMRRTFLQEKGGIFFGSCSVTRFLDIDVYEYHLIIVGAL